MIITSFLYSDCPPGQTNKTEFDNANRSVAEPAVDGGDRAAVNNHGQSLDRYMAMSRSVGAGRIHSVAEEAWQVSGYRNAVTLK